MGDQGRGIAWRRLISPGSTQRGERAPDLRMRVEHQGDGRGVVYVTEDPRLYHLVIDSGGVDWSIQVEEAVVGEVEERR